jgi:hypothetical protein
MNFRAESFLPSSSMELPRESRRDERPRSAAFPKEELSCCVKGHPLGCLRARCLELGLSASTTRSTTAEKPANTKT